jgi:hypothetical protein
MLTRRTFNAFLASLTLTSLVFAVPPAPPPVEIYAVGHKGVRHPLVVDSFTLDGGMFKWSAHMDKIIRSDTIVGADLWVLGKKQYVTFTVHLRTTPGHQFMCSGMTPVDGDYEMEVIQFSDNRQYDTARGDLSVIRASTEQRVVIDRFPRKARRR